MIQGINEELQEKVAVCLIAGRLLNKNYLEVVVPLAASMLECGECGSPAEAVDVVESVCKHLSLNMYSTEVTAMFYSKAEKYLKEVTREAEMAGEIMVEEANRVLLTDELRELQTPAESVRVNGSKVFLN